MSRRDHASGRSQRGKMRQMPITAPEESARASQTSDEARQFGCESSVVLNQRFTDLDQLVVMAREWDLSFLKLDRGPFSGHLLQAVAPGFQIGQACFQSKLKQEGLPPVHLRNIVIPAKPSQEFSWRGHQISGNSLMVFPLGSELESVSSADFEVFVLAFQEQQLTKMCTALEFNDLEALTGGAEVIQCEEQAVQNLRQTLANSLKQIMLTPDIFQQKWFAHHLEQDLGVQALSALSRGRAVTPVMVPKRQHYVLEAAESYIRSKVHEGLSIQRLCDQLNISERTLRVAFQNRYGVSPKAFLKCYQLTQVRRQLIQCSDIHTRVTDIANAWGFWHMGQFAADYKAMFGELPSETLLSH